MQVPEFELGSGPVADHEPETGAYPAPCGLGDLLAEVERIGRPLRCRGERFDLIDGLRYIVQDDCQRNRLAAFVFEREHLVRYAVGDPLGRERCVGARGGQFVGIAGRRRRGFLLYGQVVAVLDIKISFREVRIVVYVFAVHPDLSETRTDFVDRADLQVDVVFEDESFGDGESPQRREIGATAAGRTGRTAVETVVSR